MLITTNETEKHIVSVDICNWLTHGISHRGSMYIQHSHTLRCTLSISCFLVVFNCMVLRVVARADHILAHKKI